MKSNTDLVEISVVMPCLNEEQTVGVCVQTALAELADMGVSGEVVVADNGSTDRSVEIAEAHGARVVHQPIPGYGSAFLKGIAEARGQFVLLGDSDGQHDFREMDRLIAPLRNGYELVIGNRFDGQEIPGAMPWHHRYIGNPVLTGILNLLFHTGIHDAHCGMRAFVKEAVEHLDLQATGMEFASEMVILASRAGLLMTEVPVTVYPRAETSKAKLRSFRDGWRHLRFMLLHSPDWLFIAPGGTMIGLGLLLLVTQLFGPVWLGPLYFGLHFMVLGSLLALLGFQVIGMGVFSKVYAVTRHFEKRDPLVEWLFMWFNLERGSILGILVFLLGLIINLSILYDWLDAGLDHQERLREAILAMTLMIIGAQIVFSSFYLSILSIRGRE
ncbi:glycosyltransferase family 2 protein [Chloroflexota bacterium]